MSLKSKYKVDHTLVKDGAWFDIGMNSDGSKCRFKIRRTGRGNPRWQVVFREHTKDKDMDAVSPEEDEVITAKIFAEANLVDWQNFQPDDDGNNLEFNVDNAVKILANPDWLLLLNDLQNKANSLEQFQREEDRKAKLETEAKN